MSLAERRPGMTARELALLAILQAQRSRMFVQDELHALLAAHGHSAADRALATEIALGAVRHRRTLDFLLQRLLKKPLRNLPPAARAILQTAAYQMVFLERVPDYAAVDEAVELARRQGAERFAGLVNAVLRKLPSLLDRRSRAEELGNPRRLLPLPRGGALVLAGSLLPEEPERRLALAYSFPDVLVRRWLGRWGEPAVRKILQALNRPPRVFARINVLRTSAEAVLARLPEELREGALVAAAKPGGAQMLDLSALPHAALTALLDEGLITVEDPSALWPVEALDVRPGQTVLDLCAAPGGKTSYLAELMRGQGTVYAMDLGDERLELLAQTVARLGLSNVRVLANEPGHWPRDLPAQFDRVLVDVPCSNTGVLNRRAEARWRFSAASLGLLTRLQMELLAQGAQAARVGGLCVYSTCSLESEENAGLVRRFLAANPWMVLQVERETPPSAAGDGGYFARLVRL